MASWSTTIGVRRLPAKSSRVPRKGPLAMLGRVVGAAGRAARVAANADGPAVHQPGSRAARMSTRSPRNGTSSASSSRR